MNKDQKDTTKFKQELFNKLWHEKDKAALEEWIYNSDSAYFEGSIGRDAYLRLISVDYSGLSLLQLKKLLLNHLDTELQEEFKAYIKSNRNVLVATCVKDSGVDYEGAKERSWELIVGKEYYVLGISLDLNKSRPEIMLQVIDPALSNSTPYLLPAELFEINSEIVPPNYCLTVADSTIQLNPAEFVDKNYVAVEHSFWEDYFDGHEKAVSIFQDTLERLGVELEVEELLDSVDDRIDSLR